MKRNWTKIIGSFLLVGILSSCYEEYVVNPEYANNTFNFIMSPTAEQELKQPHKSKYEVSPTPSMLYGDVEFSLKHMRTRGQSSLEFPRKSFSVKVDGAFVTPNRFSEIERFKLVSMVFDYMYMEHKLAFSLFEKLGMWPMDYFFTELKINNNHQGLYLFIEDPSEFYFKNKNSEILIRRYYRGEISDFETSYYKPIDASAYEQAFDNLYALLPQYKGEALYEKLSKAFNLKNYMRKMAVDYLLKNGDATDEIFFAGQRLTDGSIYFELIPWDYDDLFSGEPHEVGRDWAIGTLLGERKYATATDVRAVLGDKLIFSIEDDIDYIVATDSFLYARYLDEMQQVTSIISTQAISQLLDSIQSELAVFFANPIIVQQTQLDGNATDMTLFESTFARIKSNLNQRIEVINEQVVTQKNQFK